VPSFPKTQGVNVVVKRAANLWQRRAELDNFAGITTRLREAYDTLNQAWPFGWSPDDLVDAMQTGDRLTYQPELAGEQIPRLKTLLPKVVTSINELGNATNDQQRQGLAERLKKEYKSDEAQKNLDKYQDLLARAKAAVSDVTASKQ
jgi:hypothetical protein